MDLKVNDRLLTTLWDFTYPELAECPDEKYVLGLVVYCVDHAIPNDVTIGTIQNLLSQKRRPMLSAEELAAVIEQAEQITERGSEVTFSNFRTQYTPTEDGKSKLVSVPLSMSEIIEQWQDITGHWPRRMDGVPFVDDPEHGLSVFHKHATASVFGYIRSRVKRVQWNNGGNFVSEAQFVAEIERTATNYSTIELLPHEPQLADVYYACQVPEPGSGEHLERLLDFYNPATPIDRELIKALILTQFWGGPPGTRPVFAVTSDEGRGVGKTKLSETIGQLAGGVLAMSANDPISEIKKRLLSPAGQTKRFVLIDNVKSMRLSWDDLEALATAQTISGHRMYTGEGQRPNTLTFVITMNGVNFSEDMAQRVLIIKLVRGEYSGTWYEEITRFISDHRDELIADIIAALRAEPQQLDGFTRWGTWEEHILSRINNPTDAQQLILERQGDANCDAEEASIIEDYFSSQLSANGHDPVTATVRIPNAVVQQWFSEATNERVRTPVVTRKLKQMANEGQIHRLSPDRSRTHGRGFLWTGRNADLTDSIINLNEYGVNVA